MAMKKINLADLNASVFEIFQKETPLLVAGDRTRQNAMTIGWGGLGTLWNQPVCTVYVRPQRYTYELMETHDYFSVAVLGPEYREEVKYCGSKSGRDTDKFRHCAFTVGFVGQDVPILQQAQIVLLCRKIYRQDLTQENFLDQSLYQEHYPQGGWHRMYIGRVEAIYQKE